ncbi:MAG: hypothetical protein U9N59_07285 [Campylobacterota bacterium]|nr:hypothetical protein [Campylobacterota bacterium]
MKKIIFIMMILINQSLVFAWECESTNKFTKDGTEITEITIDKKIVFTNKNIDKCEDILYVYNNLVYDKNLELYTKSNQSNHKNNNIYIQIKSDKNEIKNIYDYGREDIKQLYYNSIDDAFLTIVKVPKDITKYTLSIQLPKTNSNISNDGFSYNNKQYSLNEKHNISKELFDDIRTNQIFKPDFHIEIKKTDNGLGLILTYNIYRAVLKFYNKENEEINTKSIEYIINPTSNDNKLAIDDTMIGDKNFTLMKNNTAIILGEKQEYNIEVKEKTTEISFKINCIKHSIETTNFGKLEKITMKPFTSNVIHNSIKYKCGQEYSTTLSISKNGNEYLNNFASNIQKTDNPIIDSLTCIYNQSKKSIECTTKIEDMLLVVIPYNTSTEFLSKSYINEQKNIDDYMINVGHIRNFIQAYQDKHSNTKIFIQVNNDQADIYNGSFENTPYNKNDAIHHKFDRYRTMQDTFNLVKNKSVKVLFFSNSSEYPVCNQDIDLEGNITIIDFTNSLECNKSNVQVIHYNHTQIKNVEFRGFLDNNITRIFN